MKGLFALLLMFVIVSPSLCSTLVHRKLGYAQNNFNVVDYGAKGDGSTDDSNVFLKAWQDTCGSTEDSPTLIIPKDKTFLLQPLTFDGPCKSSTVNVLILGTITAPNNVNDWNWGDDKNTWIKFSNINGLVINGGGTIDGQGAPWWKNSDKRPTALRFFQCNNMKLSDLKHINSPKNHISITSCEDVSINNIQTIAPEDSPNTDGIDISSSTNIIIQYSIFSTGDDCIAINSGSRFINVTDSVCGPGHGISVGSLGKDGDYAQVEEVHVRNITFTKTTNGARIKTWVGGQGYAKKITYEDIKLYEVKNPIIIDQQYDAYLGYGENAVKVSDVTFSNIRGTTNDKNAIELNCANIGCTNIILEDIDIIGLNGERPISSCNNAQGKSYSCNPPVACLD